MKNYQDGKYYYTTGTFKATGKTYEYNSVNDLQKKKNRVRKLNKNEVITVDGISKDGKIVKSGNHYYSIAKSTYGTLSIDKDRLKPFAKGGKIDFTGPAWVDGTKSKPEYIFNHEQMEFLKSGLTNNVNLTNTLLSSLSDALNGTANANTYNSINNSNDSNIIISHAEVNVNVQEVADDYDARKIGQQALNEMVRIARKTGTNFVSRR